MLLSMRLQTPHGQAFRIQSPDRCTLCCEWARSTLQRFRSLDVFMPAILTFASTLLQGLLRGALPTYKRDLSPQVTADGSAESKKCIPPSRTAGMRRRCATKTAFATREVPQQPLPLPRRSTTQLPLAPAHAVRP